MLAFAVGAGSASPKSVLGAGTTLTWNDILLRTLYYLGVLAAGGAAVFGLRTRSQFGERLVRPLSHLLFFSLLLVFLGGSGIRSTWPSAVARPASTDSFVAFATAALPEATRIVSSNVTTTVAGATSSTAPFSGDVAVSVA